MIFLKDALLQMNNTDRHGNPVPFKLVFCTANREKGTGGEIITLEKAVLAKRTPSLPAAGGSGSGQRRNANEFENATRNIWCLVNERYYKVHIRLIDKFNSQKIVW